MVGVQATPSAAFTTSGPRPVNLRTDLAALADLIEIAFASSMDNSGRAAVREMRTMSRMPSQFLINGLSSLSQGMGQGWVWIQDGRLVGNVSIYPANGVGDERHTWVIVNVAVHPDYQRQGIAAQLMQASMDMIAERGGRAAILQVDADNPTARRLYQRLGFREERGWTSWRRSATYDLPPPLDRSEVRIARRRATEWQAEYALAEQVRPNERGGIGWLRPLHPSAFQRSLWQQIGDWFSFRSAERLVIRSEDESRILAALWVENGFGSVSTQLTLLVHPDYEGLYDEVLLNSGVRRFGNAPLTLEHPEDCILTNSLLRRYHFSIRRDVIHMRWDVPPR